MEKKTIESFKCKQQQQKMTKTRNYQNCNSPTQLYLIIDTEEADGAVGRMR